MRHTHETEYDKIEPVTPSGVVRIHIMYMEMFLFFLFFFFLIGSSIRSPVNAYKPLSLSLNHTTRYFALRYHQHYYICNMHRNP